MRLILLGLLVIAPTVTCLAATTGQDDPFALQVRQATNTVCPFDGNPIDRRMQPVPILGPDNQEVLVGTCSQSCNDSLHLKSFGDEGRTIAAAAKSNTTVDRAPKTGPGPMTPATTMGNPRNPGIQSAPPFGQPVPLATPSDATDHGAKTPAVAGTSSTGKSHKADKSEKTEKTEKTSSAKPHAASNDPDERQRAKKAAQRRDRGTPTHGKAGAMDSDEENDRRVK